MVCPRGGIGRRNRLKICRLFNGRAGSSPAVGTKYSLNKVSKIDILKPVNIQKGKKDMHSIHDRKAFSLNGFIGIGLLLVLAYVLYALGFAPIILEDELPPFLPFVLLPIIFVLFTGFTIIEPNNSCVLTFFGKYLGTINKDGFVFTMPLTSKKHVSLRFNNFNTGMLKVNDLSGNPIEIGAVVVWRVKDAAMACFNVDAYTRFVDIQSESVIRTVASQYPYDSDTQTALMTDKEEVSEKLKTELQDKLKVAGVVVEDVRLAHLAYSPEIATAMLRRQQAVAILQARKYLVENALMIVDEVIQHYQKVKSIKFSDSEKTRLVKDLLIMLTGDRDATPVLNIGD